MNTYFNIFLFSFTLLLGCSNSQTNDTNIFEQYDKHQRKAMLHYVDKEYEEALIEFDNAFAIISNESDYDYFYAAASAMRIGDKEEFKSIIRKAVVNTGAAQEFYENFSEFDDFRNKEVFNEISKEYPKLLQKFRDQLKYPNIYDEIKAKIEKDQSVRKEDVDAATMRKTDSLNIIRLIEITEQYGWQDNGWLLLWHHRGSFKEDNYVWAYFRPKINELIDKGNIRKSFWVDFEDFYGAVTERKQKYGTFRANYHNIPVRDVLNIDSIRAEAGLPPLWYVQKVYGGELPPGYKRSPSN